MSRFSNYCDARKNALERNGNAMASRVPKREIALHTALLHKQRAIRLQLAPIAIKHPWERI
jgi:hypothetical protein